MKASSHDSKPVEELRRQKATSRVCGGGSCLLEGVA